jgi:hypothetical protein
MAAHLQVIVGDLFAIADGLCHVDRIETWNTILDDKTTLLGAATTRTAIEAGIRLEFAPGVDLAELAQLADAEQDCCRFFHFAITNDDRGIGLDITAPPDALPAVTAPVRSTR